MTVKKRLSMTGAVEECMEPLPTKDTIATSGQFCDQTVGDEGSESSVMIAADNVGDPPVVPGSTSSRRRRSWFGMESRPVSGETGGDGASTPVTPRRRSLFGMSTSAAAAAAAAAANCFLHDNDETDELEEPKKPSSMRKSLFSSSSTMPKTSSPGEQVDDFASERSESTSSSRPPPTARRRSVLGSSSSTTPCLEEGLTPPRPGKDPSNQSVSSDPNNLPRRRIHHSVEPPSQDRKRGVDRAKSMDSPRKMDKGKVGTRAGGLWSSNHKNDDAAPSPRDALEVLVSPGTPKTPGSFRRLSLGSILGALGGTPVAEGTPGGGRRRSFSSGALATLAAAAAAASPANSSKKSCILPCPPITGRSRSSSTGTLEGTNDVCITNPCELVNKARVKRHLHEYSRNMLMDTLAKQVAIELAASNGVKCTPTSYHGNVGQGESIESIHKTMMKQKGRTARSNILAPHFNEIGIGIARSKDGLIFLCQLFK